MGLLTRRTVLVGIASLGAASYFAAPRIGDLFAGEIEFEPLPALPGFRRMAGGRVSTGGSATGSAALFAGLETGREDATLTEGFVEQVRADLCDSLYPDPVAATDLVPVASFSDYNCPYCRVQTEKLAAIEEQGGVAVSWHELPLLGDPSVVAAKGALAAKRQDAYLAFHRRLMRAPFQTNQDYLEVLAKDIGVDLDRMVMDMQSEDVAQEIRRSKALSQLFGFVGTPALVVGRTVVQGQISEATMRRLIDRERADGNVAGCSA